MPNWVHKAGSGNDQVQVGTWTDGKVGPVSISLSLSLCLCIVSSNFLVSGGVITKYVESLGGHRICRHLGCAGRELPL